MRLRRNQIRQDLTTATVGLEKARRDRRDGQLQMTLTLATINQEIKIRSAQKREIQSHISRLRGVVKDFEAITGKKGLAKNLRNAYRQRLITKQAMQTGTLAALETMHRLATVRGEIETKKLELRQSESNLEFLRLLLKQSEQGEVDSVTSSGADLAHLARETIRIKTLLATADTQFEAAKLQSAGLENSYQVISSNIASLEATPAARALEEPVTVLFVPYDNVENVKAGESLHGCLFSIFLCSTVGEVGKAVDGETVSVHPLFGKPMRGIFVEAKFDDTKSGTEELVHAGSSPVWF